MGDFTQIENKLQQFSRKYYSSELIKGCILFSTLGLLYLFFTLFIEYFLWLQPTARTILFWIFILIELFLLVRFIGFPIFKLFGLQKGISFEDASKIIGDHFPEVKDKLLNILQLQKLEGESDLLLASIAQKSSELKPVPFTNAINFKANGKYLKYALVPLFIWLITLFTGFNKKLTQSFNRVVNHSIAYIPPAPFSLSLTAENLEVIQGESLTIYVEAKGDVIPEEAKIFYNNQQYFLQNNGAGFFSYTFSEINNPINFYVAASTIKSPTYTIQLVETPTIQNVEMRLIYPAYLRKPSENIANTSSINVPKGTRIQWNVKTSQTAAVTFIENDNRINFTLKNDNDFEYSKRILKNLSYKIASSNQQLRDYEKLQFSVGIINDEYPNIAVKSNIDSIARGPAFFAGQISDDYGLQKLQLIYYDQQNPQLQKTKDITINKENIQTFFYEFPNGINLQEGINYELFFQVFDNDGVNGAKKTTSKKFSYRQKTTQEVKEELLQEQKDYINNLENSLEKQQKSKQDLEKVQFDLQNKKNMNWNDQKKIKNIINRQQQYKKMMQRQTDKLKENFDEKKEKNERLQEKKEDLKKRIAELKKLEKQQKLLDELKKLAEKLNKDDLIKKTKELAQKNKQQERSLERILEMTKRFYVEQKTTQIADKLQELAKKQEELAKKETSEKEQETKEAKKAQEEIKKDFEKVKEEMKKLQEENKKLKDPMDIPKMEDLQKETKEELNKAEENLEESKPQDAKKNQKKASDKMKQMANKMEKSMETMSDEMQEENMEDLRQVLENLITFSFDQEELMDAFQGITAGHPDYGKNLKKQYQLKTYFEHIDDSLFVLSMRVPKISSKIQKHLADIYYNTDQSLENFAETRFNAGVSNQRYIMTSANELVHMLSNTLDAMKNAKQGSGKGKGKKGESFSLPDIIQKQGELMKKMKDGMKKKGERGKPKDGKKGKDGKSKNGKDGKPKDGKGEKEGGKGQGTKGENEDLNGELYEIYKQQAELRQQLEDALKEGGGGNGKAKKALKEMEDLEKQILENGFTQGTLDRMQKLNYELLKLDKATFEQGRDKKRKANSNTTNYTKNTAKQLEFKKLFYNQTEILNRQSLPLRQNYKKKVKEYFSIPASEQ